MKELSLFLAFITTSILQFVGGKEIVLQNTTNERVVGGRDIPKGQYVPYQVSLQYYTKSQKYEHYCGGSIISRNLVLTAAHCCYGLKAERMSVRAGVRDLSVDEGKYYRVELYEMHPNYKQFESSDIAIVKIIDQFDLNNVSMAIIDVFSPKRIVNSIDVTLTGWGLRLPIQINLLQNYFETLNYPTVLQIMSYKTISDVECIYKGIDRLSKTEICAQGFPLKGACVGDSGGPLVSSTANGLQQVGIVSYGFFICGVFDVPDVYTRVSEFTDWLKFNINKYS